MKGLFGFLWIVFSIRESVSTGLYTVPGANPSLRLLQILFRHGDRTPLHLFPSDQHLEHWLSLGLGQLTNIGKEQHYVFGKYIKERYNGFLNTSYLWNEVVVNSTNTDRTLMSAESYLAGLYPTVNEQIWNDKMSWQPIPVHTTKPEVDYNLNPDAYCPRYTNILKEAQESTEFRAMTAKYSDLFKFISDHVNFSITNIFDISKIYDTLKIEKLHNLTLPTWLNDTVLNKMKELSDLSMTWNYVTTEEQLLKGGPLLGHMIENMNAKVNGSNSKTKLYIFSSHDTAITAFLMNLHLFNNLIPPYAAAVIVELHQLQSGYHAQILYRNVSSGEPFKLTVPGCTTLCPLETFVSLMKDRIPYNIVEQCNAKTDCDQLPWTVFIIVVCSTAVFIAILISSVIYWKQRRDLNYHRYMIVNDE